jgi:hypothetical protein
MSKLESIKFLLLPVLPFMEVFNWALLEAGKVVFVFETHISSDSTAE